MTRAIYAEIQSSVEARWFGSILTAFILGQTARLEVKLGGMAMTISQPLQQARQATSCTHRLHSLIAVQSSESCTYALYIP